MKPLFTVHSGEYLVGCEIERRFKRVNLWLPARDTGIDLLVTDQQNRRSVSLQVKFSKDFLPTHDALRIDRGAPNRLRATGWWKINRVKLSKSAADFWVFVLPSFARRQTNFIVVPWKELARRLETIHGVRNNIVQSYLWITEANRCWETRGLPLEAQHKIAAGEYHDRRRDFTLWLDNWTPIATLNA